MSERNKQTEEKAKKAPILHKTPAPRSFNIDGTIAKQKKMNNFPDFLCIKARLQKEIAAGIPKFPSRQSRIYQMGSNAQNLNASADVIPLPESNRDPILEQKIAHYREYMKQLNSIKVLHSWLTS